MQVICRTRRMGKTTDLLELAIEKGYIFICHNLEEMERLKRLCRDANQEPPEFATYDQFTDGHIKYGRKVKGLVMDNVDLFLQRIASPSYVEAVTINQDNPDANNQ